MFPLLYNMLQKICNLVVAVQRLNVKENHCSFYIGYLVGHL